MRRYRLAPRQFEFKFGGPSIGGQPPPPLIETRTGLHAHSTASSIVIGQEPPSSYPKFQIYLREDGTPADELSCLLLRRDMTDYLCVLLCRNCPQPEGSANDDVNYWESTLESHGLPAELPSLTAGGYSASDVERVAAFITSRRRRSSLATQPQKRIHRPFEHYSPLDWRRAVVRRLSLFLQRLECDPLIQRMADYFCPGRGWYDWVEDPKLLPIIEQVDRDERLQRLLSILARVTNHRAAIAKNRERPFRFRLKTPHGRFVFCFPRGRRGRRAEEERRIRELLWLAGPLLIRGRWFKTRWLAAAVYVGRECLERPKRLAEHSLTQDKVAKHFGLKRRQLTYAISRLKAPGFARPFWEWVRARKTR